jgi:hypothetical protein
VVSLVNHDTVHPGRLVLVWRYSGCWVRCIQILLAIHKSAWRKCGRNERRSRSNLLENRFWPAAVACSISRSNSMGHATPSTTKFLQCGVYDPRETDEAFSDAEDCYIALLEGGKTWVCRVLDQPASRRGDGSANRIAPLPSHRVHSASPHSLHHAQRPVLSAHSRS